MAPFDLLQAGTVLRERYQVSRLLGRGGMGAVYVVNDLNLETQQWALKEMWPASDDAEEQQQAHALFEKEAKYLIALKHPNLPRITDKFSEEVMGQRRHYLVMDYIEGQNLEQRVEKEGPISPPRLVAWALQICDLLDYLHTLPQPVILRDMKPANVMLTPSDEVKVVDLGIARVFRPGRAGDTQALGTPGYAPPEQYGRGQSDARADIYGLGATMHFALTGVNPADRPFHFESPSRYRPEVPAPLDAVIMTAVQVDPGSRYVSARALASALQMAMGWGGSSLTQAGPTSRAPFTVPVTTLSGMLSSRGSGGHPASGAVVVAPPAVAPPAMAPPAIPSAPPPLPCAPAAAPGPGRTVAPPTAPMPVGPPPGGPGGGGVPTAAGLAPPGPAPSAGLPWFEPSQLDFGVVPVGTAARLRFRIRGDVEGRLAATDRWLRVEPSSVRGRDPHGEAIVYASALKPGRVHQTSVVLKTRLGQCMLPVTLQVEPSRLGTGTAIMAALLTFFSVVPFVGLAGTVGLLLLYALVARSERSGLGGFVLASVLIGMVNALLTTGVYWMVRSFFQ